MKSYSSLGIFVLVIVLAACEYETKNEPIIPDPVIPDPVIPVSTLVLTCPEDTTIYVYPPFVLSTSLHWKVPVVTSQCTDTVYSITQNIPDTIRISNYNIHIKAENTCHETDSCFYQFIALDYRLLYIGTYKGVNSCGGWSMTGGWWTLEPDTITIEVKPGIKSNWLNIGGDEVLINELGYYPYPSIGNYRWYSASFSNGHLHRSQTWGQVSSQNFCEFEGAKL